MAMLEKSTTHETSRGCRFAEILEKVYPELKSRNARAKAFGFGEGSLRNWEAGANIDNRALRRLMELGGSMEYLLLGTGEPLVKGDHHGLGPETEARSFITSGDEDAAVVADFVGVGDKAFVESAPREREAQDHGNVRVGLDRGQCEVVAAIAAHQAVLAEILQILVRHPERAGEVEAVLEACEAPLSTLRATS